VAARLGAGEFEPMTLANGASIYGTREEGIIMGLASPTDGSLFFGSEDYLAPLALGTPKSTKRHH